MKILQFLIIVILVTITLYPNIVFADISKSVISVNDTQYDVTFNAENLSIKKILPNLHSYVYNSLDMNLTSNNQYNGSLTLTLTKDAVANVFCITRSDVDNYLKSGSAFDVRVDNNHENFTTSTTNDEVSLTFDIPKGSQNATIVDEFVGMAVSPLVHFKGIPQTGTYSSGEDVIFNGTLVDACGRHLGVEKVYFTTEQLNVTNEVTSDIKGKFNINFTIPANAKSGNYTSKIEMYQYSLAYPLNGVETLYLNVGTNYKQIVPESPLQQLKSGMTATNVKCVDGFTLVIKSEDGSPACVKPDTAQKLIERDWGFDPSSPLEITGLRDSYAVGEIINFQVKFNEMIGDCTQPSVWVMNQTNQTVWKSKEIAVPCPPDLTLHHAEGEMKFGNSELGYLSINQTGTYYIHVWFGKEITKMISII